MGVVLELYRRNVPDRIILETVKTQYHNEKLSNTELGMLFESFVNVTGWEDEEKKISPIIYQEDLLKINKYFETTNGNQWARTDQNYLGKKYKIERERKNNKCFSYKLLGLNDNLSKYRNIRADIVKEIRKQRCAILDIGTNIEVDHKNGRYDDEQVADLSTQRLEDFQPLCKTANDAKRHHCDVCIENSKRYNAQRLGYKEGWISGNENTENCIGCYWYDPKSFNKEISKDFNKQDEG